MNPTGKPKNNQELNGFLKDVEHHLGEGLGDLYLEVFGTRSPPPMSKDRPSTLWLAARERRQSETGIACSLSVEPVSFEGSGPNWRRRDGELVELAVRIPLDKRRPRADVTEVAKAAASALSGSYRVNPTAVNYPNDQPRPLNVPVLLWSQDDAFEATVDHQAEALWVASAVPLEVAPMRQGSAQQVAAALNGSMASLSRAVSYVRMLIGEDAPESRDWNTLVGWLGEYLFATATPEAQWRSAGQNDHDFELPGRNGLQFIEVKSSRSGAPTEASFSKEELQLAFTNPDRYLVARVHVDIDDRAVKDFESILVEAAASKPERRIASGQDEWLGNLARTVGLSAAQLETVRPRLQGFLSRLPRPATVPLDAVFSGPKYKSLGASVPVIGGQKIRVLLP